MRLSYSRVSSFLGCPYKYNLSYNLGLKTKFNLDPNNALVLGTAMHTGIAENAENAICNYYLHYPSVTPLMVNEAIKLEVLVEKAKAVLPDGEYERKLMDDDFIGFIDLLVPVGDGVFDIYDFKYSNAVDSYLESGQLHIYKWLFERLNPGQKVRNLAFVFIPKVKWKQEDGEEIDEYRKRLTEECKKQEIKIVPIDYNPNKVIEFLVDAKHCIEATKFERKKNKWCFFCDFKRYCESDGAIDTNIIYPTTEE